MTYSPNIKEKKNANNVYKERLSLSIDKRRLDSDSLIRRQTFEIRTVLVNGITSTSKSKKSVVLDEDNYKKSKI